MDRLEKAVVFGGRKSASGGGDSILRTSDGSGAVRRGRRKLTGRRS